MNTPPETNKIYQGNALDIMRTWPDGFVHACITSPPYFGLRNYGTEPQIWGGDPKHAHAWGKTIPGDNRGGSGTPLYGEGEHEHKIPLSPRRGEPKGTNHPNNIVLSCRPCNLSKHNRTVENFLHYLHLTTPPGGTTFHAN